MAAGSGRERMTDISCRPEPTSFPALDVATMTDIDKHNCARRELRMRQRAYPGRVADGRMTAIEAAREIAIMAAIAADYAQADLFGGKDG
jgi:hypothetical protein